MTGQPAARSRRPHEKGRPRCRDLPWISSNLSDPISRPTRPRFQPWPGHHWRSAHPVPRALRTSLDRTTHRFLSVRIFGGAPYMALACARLDGAVMSARPPSPSLFSVGRRVCFGPIASVDGSVANAIANGSFVDMIAEKSGEAACRPLMTLAAGNFGANEARNL